MNRNRILFSLLLLCLLPCSDIQAQVKVYAGLGFNQSITNIDSLNYVVARYNSLNNPDKELSEIRSPRGLAINAGLVLGRVMIDLGYTMRAQGSRSREQASNSPETYFIRQLRFRMNTFDVGFGVKLNKDEEKLFALGASLDFGAVRVFTRYVRNDQTGTQPFRNPIMNELTLGSTLFFHGQIPLSSDLPFQLYFRPYYHLDLYRNDYGPVNRAVNQPDHLDDPLFLLSSAHNFGLKVGVLFFGG